MLALLFPGQGSQEVGMAKDVFDASSAARAVFEAATRALGKAVEENRPDAAVAIIGDNCLIRYAESPIDAKIHRVPHTTNAMTSLAFLGQLSKSRATGDPIITRQQCPPIDRLRGEARPA